jgi:hypothetical protein
MKLKALIFIVGISLSAQTVKYNPFTSQLDLVGSGGSGDVSGGGALTTAGAVPYITGAATLGEMPLITYKSGTGNLLIGGTTEQNFKLDLQGSGSSGTLQLWDKTAITGTTNLTIRGGAGQSTSNLLTVLDNGGVTLSAINYLGALVQQGTSATISSGFGTSPAIDGTWNAGRITVGTGGVATSGVISFGVTLPKSPSCWASAEGETKVIRPTPTTTQLTLTVATAFSASSAINWGCFLIKP